VANPVGLEVSNLQPFDFCPGIPSAVETFSVAGTNLSATVTITAPTGFEIRKTGDVAYDTMITLPIDINGTLSITSLEIRVAESATVTMTADISITSATDSVTLTVTATAAPPEIITVQGNNVNIFAGDDNPDTADDTQFGTVTVNKPATKTYTIQNTGGRPLVVSAISLTGPDAAAFTVGDISLPATVPPGGSTTFTVTVNAGTAGLKAATVVISSDDNCSVIGSD
jgi:hypothetical protein